MRQFFSKIVHKSGTQWRTLQLLLPVLDPHQPRTLYLCHGSGLENQPWKHLGLAFSLPKVTPTEVLNVDTEYYQDEEYIQERQKGMIYKNFLIVVVSFSSHIFGLFYLKILKNS